MLVYHIKGRHKHEHRAKATQKLQIQSTDHIVSSIAITLLSSTGSPLRKHGTRKHSRGGQHHPRTVAGPAPYWRRSSPGCSPRTRPSCVSSPGAHASRSQPSTVAAHQHALAAAYSASPVMHARRARPPYRTYYHLVVISPAVIIKLSATLHTHP